MVEKSLKKHLSREDGLLSKPSYILVIMIIMIIMIMSDWLKKRNTCYKLISIFTSKPCFFSPASDKALGMLLCPTTVAHTDLS